MLEYRGIVEMAPLEFILSIGFVILLSCYIIQAFIALLSGLIRPPAAPGIARGPSLASRLFGGVGQIRTLWATIIIVFVLPVGISWLTSFSLNTFDAGPFVYTGCLGTLLVMLTLEFSELNEINNNNRAEWQTQLLVALGLDLVSLLFLAWPMRLRVYQVKEPDWGSVGRTAFFLAMGSLCSGLLVVIFARKAGEP